MADYLYEQIVTHIIEGIRSGKFDSQKRLPTEAELSEQFNVSRITAKRAMDILMRQNIIIRRKRLGSFINPAYNADTGVISDLYGTESGAVKNLIGLLLPINVDCGDMILYVNGALDYLMPRGYYLIISNSNRNSERERELLNKFISDKLSGIIYYPFSDKHNYALMTRLRNMNYPIVMIDKYFSGIDLPSVVPDSFSGAVAITRHMIECGHHRIAFFCENEIPEQSTIQERFAGYSEALRQHEMALDESLIFENLIPDSNISSDEYVDLLIEPIKTAISRGATAIFFPSDGMAVNAITACSQENIKVPDDISVTGFDDLQSAQYCQVPLTTVRQDLYEMGKTAARMLVRQLENRLTKRQVLYPIELIIRKSVKNLKES